MTKKIKIGITGGIGSGKSTVASIFELFGAEIFYSDQEAKKLMVTCDNIISALKEMFAPDDPYKEGGLDRTLIASKIFHNKALLSKINDIVHPEVRKAYLTRIKNSNLSYVINEAALLTNFEDEFDILILVQADQEKRIQRVKLRDQLSASDVLARIENQLADNQRGKIDYIIDNNDKLSLIDQVQGIHNAILNRINS